MRDRGAMVAVGTLALLAAPTLRAQGALPVPVPVRVTGVVRDAATARAIADAEVLVITGDTLRLRSDARGTWSARVPATGELRVVARRLGYAPATRRWSTDAAARATLVLSLDAVPQSLDQTVVTAARRPQRLADAVTTIEVVTRAEIERTGAADLANVLLEQTGIQLQGGHPSGAGVMLQGLSSERVLVLLDGQPVTGRIGGTLDLARIPTAMVERVEVVKGPQSTLYGTDAMGGVINIITRTPARGTSALTLGTTLGSQDRRDGTLSLALGRGAYGSQLDVQRRHVFMTPGRASGDGALSDRTDGALKLRWRPDSSRSLEANVLALDERQRWRTGTFFGFADNRQLNARVSGAWVRGRHRVAPTVSLSDFENVARTSTLALPIAGDTGRRQHQRTAQAELLYDARLGARGTHVLTLGTQLRRDAIEGERVTGGARSLLLVEPFTQLEWAPTSRLAVVPGARLSHSAQWGSRLTPRLAARWRASERLTLRASAGEGFRVPDFKELYMFFTNTNAGYAVIGDSALRPESSRNASLGAEWTWAAGFVRAQLFHNRYRGFIETRPVTQPGEAPVFRYANVDDGMTQGVDMETGLLVGGWRVDAGYGALRTRDRTTGLPLLGRPAHSGRVALARTLPFGVRTSVTTVATGRTPMERDSTGRVSSWRDAFVRIDARLARRFTTGMELVVGADNLLNALPAAWAGFTGRHVYTALSWNVGQSTPR
ncbi:MAG: TonB-dependent receptor [Gemmatimonadaceae bacterium]|nr:TonB-dependent receptor [Gemmatimonadaceae bacterium]